MAGIDDFFLRVKLKIDKKFDTCKLTTSSIFDNLRVLNIKFPLIFYFLFFSYLSFKAQNTSPKSYALVIGVSKYEDPKINALKYANKDATEFASFCLSPSGLNIPSEQLILLTDEKASYWNIVDGLNWLKKNTQMNDQVYIYFAGHGDMESKVLKYGYLLAHDSKHLNYLGRSLSLDLLNKTAHTLTADKKAKVFLITDACHSGKLAGVDFNGSNLVALNLMELVNMNEVRITSCNEGELSYEDEVWGNGRGAFSYFLTKGMAGEADGVGGKKDGNITIEEIKYFLTNKVSNAVKTVKSKKQNPVIMGSEKMVLNSFIPTINNQNNSIEIQGRNENIATTGSRSVSAEPDNALEADILQSINSNPDIDFAAMSSKPDTVLVDELLEKLWEEGTYDEDILTSPQTSQLLAKILYQKVQHIIDLYLDGDEAELEKRRFYKQVDRPYEQYPYMLEIAIKLLPQDHILIPTLNMQKEYLKGLAYRLKVPFTKDYMVLIDSAYISQQKALAIDSNAAYIHNEIGILYLHKENEKMAKYHFEKASVISPLWSLPYSNLAYLYLLTKDNIMAKKYVDIALEKQENLQSPYLLDGTINMNENNLLFAEEQFQKAIKLNSRYYFPFEKLGELYLSTQDYVESNKYFFEAEVRKIGLLAEPKAHAKETLAKLRKIKTCEIDSSLVSEGDIMAHFAVGKRCFDKNDYQQAQSWFEKVVSFDLTNPMVYHYLGQISYYFKSYDKAEFYFKRAIELYLPDTLFREHLSENALKSLYYQQFKDNCLYTIYEKSQFELYDSKIYLAKTYEKWKNYFNAAEQYNDCIDLKPNYRVAFYMLWNMYKHKNELELAEITIQRFGKYHPDLLDEALADFYKWALYTFKEDLQKTEHYAYKYGLLMHNYILKSPENDWGESLEITSDNEEKDFPNDFSAFIFYGQKDEKERLVEEVVFIEPEEIEKPFSTGVAMLKTVTSLSIENRIKADAYVKIGDIYYQAKSDIKALENYEKSLSIKDDDTGIRTRAIEYADQRYLFKKAFDHLKHLNETNSMGYDGAMLQAKYYMKSGNRNQAIDLYNKISSTHPFLKESVKKDVIKLYLRFAEFYKAIELIHQHTETDTTDRFLEYMLARSYAGLNKPEEALKHLQNANQLGFDLGFVYKNDDIFDPYRTLNADWVGMEQQMDSIIADKMAPIKKDSD